MITKFPLDNGGLYFQLRKLTFIVIPASNFRYEITGGNIGGAFGIRNRTGDIFVAGSLDYETKRKVCNYDKLT